MPIHTRAHPTRTSKRSSKQTQPKAKKGIPWRVAARAHIKKYTEAGLALKGARLKADMTQRELAEAIDVKPHHISEMENGKRTIGKQMAHRLADALDINYKVFL